MAMKKHTRLDLVEGGNIFKQGDYVTLGFIPRDYTGASVDLTNKQIEGSIFNGSTGVIYEGPASFVDGKIFFTIKQVLNDGKFQLEFTVTDAAEPEYRTKFPTDDYASELTIKPSADNLDYVGVSMTTVAQLRTEQEQKQQQFEQVIVPQVKNIDTQLKALVVQGDSSPQATQASVGAGGEDYNGNLKARLDAEYNTLTTQLAETSNKTQETFQSVTPSVLTGVSITDSYTGVLPLEYHEGELYGIQGNDTIVKSNDSGETWETVATSPLGTVTAIFWMNDGEVLMSNNTNIVKSTGWANNPATANWTTKVTISTVGGVGILRWGIDSDGEKVIATEYSGVNRAESRYIWISTDRGNTFSVVYDRYEVETQTGSHFHAVCYDKWADRFWFSQGHGANRGVYFSDDDGANWTKIGGDFQPDAAPTTMTATDNGIVCGSDAGDAGLYGIVRTENPADMEMKPIARWHVPRAGVTGFAYRSFREEKTGLVYVSFKSDFEDVASVIMAGTATAGSTVWQSPTKGVTAFPYLAVTDNKVLGVIQRGSTKELIKGNLGRAGTRTFDANNVEGGKTNNSTSIAMGTNVNVTTSFETVIGTDAAVTGTNNNTVIGARAKSKARGVALGFESEAREDDGVAIGYQAKSYGVNGIVIGKSAETSSGGTSAIAIGNNSRAFFGGTAIGSTAKSGVDNNSNGTVAIGYGSNADGVNATAIGHSASTFVNATGAVAIGQAAKGAVASVMIGTGAKSTAQAAGSAVAIGFGATITGEESIAIGRDANAVTKGVAIGRSASASHTNSIAIGVNAVTTDSNQLSLGARHIEVAELASTPAAPAANGARLFSRDNGSGKTELCVRFNTGVVAVLAVEA